MRFNLVPGVVSYLQPQTQTMWTPVCLHCIKNFHWATVILLEPRGQQEQRQKSQRRPGLKSGWAEIWKEIQLMRKDAGYRWPPMLCSEHLSLFWLLKIGTVTATYNTYLIPHIIHKDHHWKIRPHKYQEDASNGGKCVLWNLVLNTEPLLTATSDYMIDHLRHCGRHTGGEKAKYRGIS